jgi:hypothetical protein
MRRGTGELRPQPIGVIDLVSVSAAYQGFDARHRLMELRLPNRCMPVQLACFRSARRRGQLDFLDALIQPEPQQRKVAVIVYHERAVEGRGRFVGDETRGIEALLGDSLIHLAKRWGNVRQRPSSHELTRSQETQPTACGRVTH